MDVILQNLETQLYNNIFVPGERTDLTKKDIVSALSKISEILIYQHNGLFLHLVNNLINKVHVFGLHFAALDVRQESSVHSKVIAAVLENPHLASLRENGGNGFLPVNYSELNDAGKIDALMNAGQNINGDGFEDVLIKDTLDNMHAIKKIQEVNGVEGCSRYIISPMQQRLKCC